MLNHTEQLNIFDVINQAQSQTATTATASSVKTVEPCKKAGKPILKFVTDRQLEVMRTSPYASFVRGKSLEELNQLENTIGSDLWKKRHTAEGERRLEEWRTALYSAQTIALEIEYKKLDARFCFAENGFFHLIDETGKETAVGYKYCPFYFDQTGERTMTPIHHLEFNSGEIPTEISGTGYRSHFFGDVPYTRVKNFADFLVQTLRIDFKITAKIVFEGQEFAYDASLYPAPKPKDRKKKCPECRSPLDRDGECLDCDYSTGDGEEDFEGNDEFDENAELDFEELNFEELDFEELV